MKTFFISLKIFLFFTILTGIFYPLFITGLAQFIFPRKANGSMITMGNHNVGSELIGQQFDSVIYFTSRPSAVAYNPLPSGGSNYGMTNSKLKVLAAGRTKQFKAFNQLDSAAIVPSEMLFESASGLDPQISPEASLMQVNRIAKARKLNNMQKKQLIALVNSQVEHAQFGILGQSRINVLRLNCCTDTLFAK
jgi:potassium-transporting ATPase KdpC subunit